MSGHSKWSTIKHQKAVADQKRGQLFTKLARGITMATREGGGDLETNFKLRLAVDKARQANMPKENIKRAIDRGTGKGSEGELTEAVYEGYGPFNIAVMVEVVTDNKNRTASAIRQVFDKQGGKLGQPGSVSFLFNKKGSVLVEKQAKADEQMLKLIDLGVDEVIEEKEGIWISVEPHKLLMIKKAIEKSGQKVLEADLDYLAKTPIKLEDDKRGKVLKFIEKLDDLDDVQDIYTNLD